MIYITYPLMVQEKKYVQSEVEREEFKQDDEGS